MKAHLTIKPLDPPSPKAGFTCCVCGELSFEKAACVVLSDEHKTYGNVCMNCIASGPKKAAATAYDLACGMRQVSDRQFHLARRLSEIHTWHVEKYKRERMREPGARGEHPSPATVNRELACLKKMYSLAIRWGKALENPAKPVELMKEREAGRRLTCEEKQALIDACNESLKKIVIFAMNTGRRLNEILNLRWQDVNFQTWHITLRDTKSGDSQTIPVNSEVKKLLAELPKDSEWVFTNHKGERI